MKLKEKVALVTGGARGIGAAIVDRYVAEGGRAAVDISFAHDAQEPAASHGDKAYAVALDVTKTASIQAAVESVVQRWGGVNTSIGRSAKKKRLVGDAAPFGRMGLPEDHTGAAVFLASADSDYVVAQTLNVDGGNWMS
jgi:D-sorbitol dehydrogenase (acceptor)